MCDVYGEDVLLKNHVYRWAKNGFATTCLSQKKNRKEETYWLSGKEKVPCAVVSKGGDADSHLGHEKNHHYRFPWKRCDYKLCFLLPTLVKFILFIGIPRIGHYSNKNDNKIKLLNFLEKMYFE